MKKQSHKVILLSSTLLISATIFISSLLFFSSEVQLTEYTCENQDESQIIALLSEYQQARNRFNLPRFLACLHEHGQFSFMGAAMVSKKKLKDSLPDFWATLQSEDRYVVYPITHEFVTGDFFLSGRLIDPHIVISGDTAKVTATFASGLWRQKHFISLIRVDQRWLINRLDWEEV